MASRDPRLVNLDEPLTEYEIRYLRKAIRYRLFGLGIVKFDPARPDVTPPRTRTTMPPRDFPDAGVEITRDRAAELDQMADWFLQEAA